MCCFENPDGLLCDPRPSERHRSLMRVWRAGQRTGGDSDFLQLTNGEIRFARSGHRPGGTLKREPSGSNGDSAR